MDLIKVSANSRSTSVAGAIAGVVREHMRAEVQAIGASAVNQAVKAVAIARGYLALDGIDVIAIPSFTEVDIDNQERTAVRLIVEPRQNGLNHAPVERAQVTGVREGTNGMGNHPQVSETEQ